MFTYFVCVYVCAYAFTCACMQRLKDNFSTRISSPHLSCGAHGPIQVVRLSGMHLSFIQPFCWSNIFYIGTRFLNGDPVRHAGDCLCKGGRLVSSSTVGGTVKDNYCGKQFGNSSKRLNIVSMWLSSFPSRYILRGIEDTCLHKNLYTNVMAEVTETVRNL